jgi:hypothetical protein
MEQDMTVTREMGSRDGPTRDELQDDLMRFEGRFSSRLTGAFRPLVELPRAEVRLRAAQDELAFKSSALDIAVGSSPEVDLLDMVTLVALGRDAMTRRWSEAEYGEAASGLPGAFQSSLEDIGAIARRVFPQQVETELREVIAQWQRENPEQHDITAVRLSAYARYRAASTSKNAGVFSLIRGATQTADTAVLLGDRALYATQRLPYLVRLHVRIALREFLVDGQRTARRLLARSAVPLLGLVLAGSGASLLVGGLLFRRLARR